MAEWYSIVYMYHSFLMHSSDDGHLGCFHVLPIIQSEVSHKEKHQYSILTHIYGIYKDGNNNPVCETAKETQMYITVFWILWKRARVGWFGRMALKCIISYVKRITSPGSMHDTRCSGLVHWDDPEGWYLLIFFNML